MPTETGVYVESPQLVAPCVVRNAYQTLGHHPHSPDPSSITPNCPTFRKPSHIQFTRPDQQVQSTRQLSAAHAAAAAYHNLMFFQLQQQQQQQQQQFQHHPQRQFQQQSQLSANFPPVSTMHPIHLAAAAAAAVSSHSCIQNANTNPMSHSELSWSTTSSAVTDVEDPAAAAAASYYAAAAAAAAAVAQHGQQQQQQQEQQQQQLQHRYHRQELEQFLFDQHSIHLGTQLTAAEQCQLSAHLLRQQQQQHPLGKF
ncbi:unnamed protein product [Echinostoma caproni]|uniref:Uncharacterized protein n=1 Tax=Echinostoma caproni TaxID=27848 RepID=A0A183BGA9_9TREM|nr:unnamed protein product [Echinostoma caproni]